jgi:cobalt-zinc-cadmium efflux system outer membrane protein
MGRLLLLGVLVLSLLGHAEAQPPAPYRRLTVDDAIRLAMAQNPALRAKESELRVVQANEITAALRPNPVTSYSAEQFGAHGVETQHTVILGQPVETGGKRQRRIDSARAASRVSGFELADVRRQIVYQVRKAFTDILVAQASLDLAEQNLRTLDDVERIQRFRADRGDISELELLRIQVQRFAFERDAVDARQALAAGKIALAAAIGRDGATEEVEIVGDLTYRQLGRTRADLEQATLANRPDVRAAEAARAQARAEHNLARANAWWDVTPAARVPAHRQRQHHRFRPVHAAQDL